MPSSRALMRRLRSLNGCGQHSSPMAFDPSAEEALAVEFGLFLTGKVLDLFRAHLTDKGQAKIDAARAKLPQSPAPRFSASGSPARAGANNDDGIMA